MNTHANEGGDDMTTDNDHDLARVIDLDEYRNRKRGAWDVTLARLLRERPWLAEQRTGQPTLPFDRPGPTGATG
jgi:hypothetical protein